MKVIVKAASQEEFDSKREELIKKYFSGKTSEDIKFLLFFNSRNI